MHATLRLPLTPQDAAWARWRVWAAEVRDRTGRFVGVPAEAPERARVLCALLDAHAALARRSRQPDTADLAGPVALTILAAVGWLALAGVPVPEGGAA
jgi:hypothetical protein